MPIDPSIITSGNQMPQIRLPDVNAMMQTRTAGMENIYKIEQARAEQAKAAQKEQKAALVEALTPAYATAYKGGGTKEALTAAVSLLPPEMQTKIAPTVEKLMALPSDDLRLSALETSLANGGDVGRAILARIPTENQLSNTAIQRGQLDIARQRLALEESQVGVPKPMTEYEKAQLGLREREVKVTEEKAKRAAETPEGMDPKTKKKFDEAYPKAYKAVRSAVTGLDSDIADVQALLNDTAGLAAITGTLDAMTPDLTADATRAAALYDKITAGAGFTALNDLRAASPTGGAVGNVSNEEGRKLQASVAAFSRKQKTKDFADAMRKYLVDLKIARENVLSSFEETYSYKGDVNASNIAGNISEQRKRLEQETMPQEGPPPPAGGGFRILNVR